MKTIGESVSKQNNLNAIRLALALLVIFTHSFQISLGRAAELKTEPLFNWSLQQQSFGDVAVNLFFFISGLLITMSWLKTKSMQDFLWHRILRIYPAFICAMIFSAVFTLILSPEFRTSIGHGISWLKTFIGDCCSLDFASLRSNSILRNNPSPGTANGSLWSIQKEFCCYLLVALLGLLSVFKMRKCLTVATFIVFLDYAAHLHRDESDIFGYSRCFTYFLMGMIVWLWRDKIPFSKRLAFACAALLLATLHLKPWFSIIFPFAGSYLVLWVAYGPQFPWLAWTEKTDLSYGTYLFAFPIQQLIALHSSLRIPWLNFLITVPIVLCLAWLSWHIVEKRCLALKHIRRVDYDPAALQTSLVTNKQAHLNQTAEATEALRTEAEHKFAHKSVELGRMKADTL